MMKLIDKQRFDNLMRECNNNFDEVRNLAFMWYQETIELMEENKDLQRQLYQIMSDLNAKDGY